MQIPFKKRKEKLRLYYINPEKPIPSINKTFPSSVRRRRRRPPPPPRCCWWSPSRRPTARWCRWTSPRRAPGAPPAPAPGLRVGCSRRSAWRSTSAATRCGGSENPWRPPRSQLGVMLSGEGRREERKWQRKGQEEGVRFKSTVIV